VVRAVANRAFLPIRSVLERVGDMMVLTGKTIWSALRPPYPYGGEFVNQFLGGFLVFTQTLLATHPEISIIK
jgi:phospholipid/cholesterol/gamma-HCH transport system permease protein